MSHLLTGSDDGYIRDYDIFSGVNGKVFLTAPQRHHCGVMEGLMKAAQIKLWWENPVPPDPTAGAVEEQQLCAPYSLIMHSDALWAIAGTEVSQGKHEANALTLAFSMVTSTYIPCDIIPGGYATFFMGIVDRFRR